MFKRHPQNRGSRIAGALALAAALGLLAGIVEASDQLVSVRVTSVIPVGDGRYDISGIAVDDLVNPACSLVLASGRCMFSCGPGSLRCEGGTADLPFGRFELFDLPVETDGSIRLQVFIENHLALATPIAPEPLPNAARWGVINTFCCPSSRSTFEVTIGDVTKRSVIATCGLQREWEPTWEGWTSSSIGTTRVTAAQTEETCEPFDMEFTSTNLSSGSCFLYSLKPVNGSPEVVEQEIDCASLP
jgi:hypothetical protein